MAATHFTPGAKFGRLSFVERIASSKHPGRLGLFRCDCGVEKVLHLSNVRSGASKSCGCLKTSDWLRSVYEFGQRFGRLVYVGEADKRGVRRVVARCDCGDVRSYVASALTSGNTQSCGCLRLEINSALAKIQMTKHGMTGTPTFNSWSSAIERCYRKTADQYPHYGGRGITVCDRWRESFENFLADMGERPDGCTLDRHPDVDGNYEPGNCRWATAAQQANNKRNSRYVTRDGRTQTITEWAREFGIYDTLPFKRRAAGWPEERWFEPSQKKSSRLQK